MKFTLKFGINDGKCVQAAYGWCLLLFFITFLANELKVVNIIILLWNTIWRLFY